MTTSRAAKDAYLSIANGVMKSLAFNRSDARADDTVDHFRRVGHIFLTNYLFRKVI